MIEFQINQSDVKKMLRALDRLESKVKRLESQHPFSCATDYQVLVKKNLLSQKFATLYSYPAYSKRYAKWKTKTMGKSSHFWKLFGDLFRAISVFKVGRKDWFGGVPANVFDRGGKSWFGKADGNTGKPKRIAMYGHKGEKKRPLFKPTALEYAKKGWLKQGGKALHQMGKQWR